ncbi:PCN-1 protein [Aphelenchoides avenae]|nr:PCN-1 protein [Aphelenchus avenae]
MFEAKLGQAAILKRITEAIKDLVTDAPFDCTEGSMCLQAMDASHVALVSLKLEVGLFESYRCDRTISLGLSLANMSKALKCSNNDDTCMIRFEDNEDSVTFTFEDTKKNKKQDVTMKLMDIDNEHLGIPDQKYSVQIEMPSAEFQKTCKDLAMFSDSLTITATKSGVVFKGAGDTGGNVVTYGKDDSDEAEDDTRVDIEVKEAVSLNFSIKYMNQFAKATSLSNRVRISMCNNVPVVIEYGIEENGFLRFYLAPKIDDETTDNME